MNTDHTVEMLLAQIDLQTPDEHWIHTLSDGSHVLIRPLLAKDREREFAFINGLSSQARRFRFLGTITEASSTLIDQLMDVDDDHRLAYIALSHQDGQLKEVGVSRYAALDSGLRCECAVVVADAWQRRGLGLLLMEHLIDAARRNHFKTMSSLDLTDNHAMQHLAKKLGFVRFHKPAEFTDVIHELDLQT